MLDVVDMVAVAGRGWRFAGLAEPGQQGLADYGGNAGSLELPRWTRPPLALSFRWGVALDLQTCRTGTPVSWTWRTRAAARICWI